MNVTNTIGTMSETIIEMDILKHGYNILHPKVTTRYDKVIDLGGSFKKIQVKTARIDRRDGNLRVTFTGYKATEIDYYAVYAPPVDEIYYIPITDIPPDAKGFTIRLTERKNKRKTHSLPREKYNKFPFTTQEEQA